MNAPERVQIADVRDKQDTTLTLVQMGLDEIKAMRKENADFRHEWVGVIKDLNTRVDKLEQDDHDEIVKAAALGAVEAKKKSENDKRWGFWGKVTAVAASVATIVFGLLTVAHNVFGLF